MIAVFLFKLFHTTNNIGIQILNYFYRDQYTCYKDNATIFFFKSRYFVNKSNKNVNIILSYFKRRVFQTT